jgi:hypothetical protein
LVGRPAARKLGANIAPHFRGWTSRLRPPHSLGKAEASDFLEPPMLGIAAIVIFIVVFGALNFFEFGRLD